MGRWGRWERGSPDPHAGDGEAWGTLGAEVPMERAGPHPAPMGAVGGDDEIGGPSVALRDGNLGYGIWSQADLVIRVPMAGGTHVARGRRASTSEVARTS